MVDGERAGHFSLREKIISWVWFVGSRLKLLFHWKDQLLYILSQHLNGWLMSSILWTIENKEVSSAKHLSLEDRSNDKSFMQIKKKKGSNINYLGTPTLTSFH